MGTLTRTQEAVDLSNAITDLGATGGEWDTLLDKALTAERHATVERIRDRLAPLDTEMSGNTSAEIVAILDEEAAR